MDYKDYLYSGQTTIFFYAYVEDVEDHSEYVPLIKAWMEKLYNADFKWYFELREKGNDELHYFTLDPGDNGFTSVDDWSDELIAKYIEDNIKSYNMEWE